MFVFISVSYTIIYHFHLNDFGVNVSTMYHQFVHFAIELTVLIHSCRVMVSQVQTRIQV